MLVAISFSAVCLCVFNVASVLWMPAQAERTRA